MKKLCAIALSVCLVFLMLPLRTSASESRTVFYIDYGNVEIGESSVSGYDKSGKLVTEVNPCGYTVTQSNTNRRLDYGISVVSGTQDVEIKNLNIERVDENDSAFCVINSAAAKLTVTGENQLISGTYRAGVEIGLNASLTIEGDGSLYAQSDIEAGIGGGSGRSNGTLTINSGTIYAKGGVEGYGTGIGGGSSGNGGTITINGGNITAVGGEYGAGIGGGMLGKGGTITINGGTITSMGGAKAAGIGGGFTANGGTVTINGGSVKAVGGTGAEYIGNGYNCKTAFNGIHNSDGKAVSSIMVALSGFESVYQNGIDGTPITSSHPNDSNLYLFSDDADNLATAYMSDGSVKFLSYNQSGYTEINPFTNGEERFLKYLITSDKSGVSVADGFSTEKENCRLIYNGSCVDEYEIVARGDVNLDGNIDGMDAVEAACVESGMLDDKLLLKLADVNSDGRVDSADVESLRNSGVAAE